LKGEEMRLNFNFLLWVAKIKQRENKVLLFNTTKARYMKVRVFGTLFMVYVEHLAVEENNCLHLIIVV